MSSELPPPGDDDATVVRPSASAPARPLDAYPLVDADPARIDRFWLDARVLTQPAGVSYLAHDDEQTPALIVLLSEGAAADPAARDRMAGLVNKLHIDTVLARGGRGQDEGRLARKFHSTEDDPVAEGGPAAPWVALATEGPGDAPVIAANLLDEVELSMLAPQGHPSGPDYQHYWIDKVRPGLTRSWPLPWPGRTDRAGWVSLLVSWLLMLLLAALAILIAILIWRNAPVQTPPPPSESSSSPQSGSPSPQSGSPSPSSGSPSPSPSPSESSPSQSPSRSGSASPSESGSGSPSPSGSEAGSPSPRSKL